MEKPPAFIFSNTCFSEIYKNKRNWKRWVIYKLGASKPTTMSPLIFLFFCFTFEGCNNPHHPQENISSTKNKKGENIRFSDTIGDNKNVEILTNPIETRQSYYKILPVNESGSDSTLVSFIANLKEVVSRKDISGLPKTLDNSIIVSHGGGIYGKAEFSKEWGLNEPEKSELWAILSQILSLGGTWENDEGKYFCIPYTQSNKAFRKFKYDFDWYNTAVCISPATPVYKEPKSTSQVIATLFYEIVQTTQKQDNFDFMQIYTIDKKIHGFINRRELIHSAAQHLEIRKINKEWKITAFAGFD